MTIKDKVRIVVALSLATLSAAVLAAGCGSGSSSAQADVGSGQPTPAALQPTPTPSASKSISARRAAKVYFAAMASVIRKEKRLVGWEKNAVSHWRQTYGNTDPSADDWRAWDALAAIFRRLLREGRVITKRYEAITPPQAFWSAHVALLEAYRDVMFWAEDVTAAMKLRRATRVLLILSSGPKGPSGQDVLAEFKDAAARVKVKIPAKLIAAFSSD